MPGGAAWKDAVSLHDLEALARAAMDPEAFDFVAGGAGDEVTLRENAAAFARRRLWPRVLTGVVKVDTSATMLGAPVSMPVGLAPAALQGLAHPDGEIAAARAAASAGVVYCLSTVSTHPIEAVGAATDGAWWFQLYIQKDRALTEDLVRRAEAAGCRAVVLTVDLPVTGYRDRELRQGFAGRWDGLGNFDRPGLGDLSLRELIATSFDPLLTWDDVGWVRSLSALPLVVKGILTPDDAELAAAYGASAVVVSNHGGRQLDRCPASLDVLEEVVTAVGGRLEVYLDGGVRRGGDVVIALALGAQGVFIGRPYLYALAAGGEDGVRRALELLSVEMRNAMTLLGTPDLGSVTRSHVV
ncbi:MAG: 4-hydroxymandelate oxidase [Actinomycetota bacterium]|nr:4-hydroxymandelate oxidase [Actinomycetota bacterium]